MANQLEIITAKQAESERKKLKSIWSQESSLSQRILIAILAHLERAEKPKPKRKPSAYNKFFAKEASKGLGATEIAAKWNAQKKQV